MMIQLELPLPRRGTKAHPCIPNHRTTIPGLDAELCRCPHCLSGSNGIWWVDVDQRIDCLDKRKHKRQYLIEFYRQVAEGIDHDDETKESKAQASKRKHAAWAGQKKTPIITEEDPSLWQQ